MPICQPSVEVRMRKDPLCIPSKQPQCTYPRIAWCSPTTILPSCCITLVICSYPCSWYMSLHYLWTSLRVYAAVAIRHVLLCSSTQLFATQYALCPSHHSGMLSCKLPKLEHITPLTIRSHIIDFYVTRTDMLVLLHVPFNHTAFMCSRFSNNSSTSPTIIPRASSSSPAFREVPVDIRVPLPTWHELWHLVS